MEILPDWTWARVDSHRPFQLAGAMNMSTPALKDSRQSVAVQPGETWQFQAWFRDVGGTSNLTDGVAVSF